MKYTNGVGHLIMSVLLTISGMLLILFTKDVATQGTGVSMILTVQAAWFVSGGVKQLASEIVKQLPTSPPTIPPPAS